jgi:tRNA-specific 2-thiouridylase
VCRLDTATGDVYLTNKEDDLFSHTFFVSGLAWSSTEPPPAPLECQAQVRYRAKPVAATLLDVSGGRGKVILHKQARAVAPGQAAVFYDEDRVLGRGWIDVGSA